MVCTSSPFLLFNNITNNVVRINIMENRIEMLRTIYGKFDEDKRLTASRQGQLEYFITMNYVDKYTRFGDKILEIGAGTGRYSIALAKNGYDVTAVELVESNLEVLKKNAEGLENISAFQGDALNLGSFDDNTFDVTLLFGPMYHLYEEKDRHKALDEAIRVTKPDGVILVAFLSVHAIMMSNYLLGNFKEGFMANFDEDHKVKHFTEQAFTGFDIAEFEEMFEAKPVEYITTVAADSILEIAERNPDFNMSDEDFGLFLNYQMNICEKREMLGLSSHLLYICRKIRYL